MMDNSLVMRLAKKYHFCTFFAYYSLLMALAEKEIKIKYKSAALGWVWSILHPLLLMIIFALIFTFFFRITIDSPPLYLLAGLLPWFFFSSAVSSATTSVVDNASLIKTVRFPRYIIPLAAVAANFLNFGISMAILLLVVVVIGGASWSILLLPLIIVNQVIFTAGMSLLSAALHTLYRDVKYVVEILLLIWLYATPIFYPLSIVPEQIQPFFRFNPLAVVINQYRVILVYQRMPELMELAYMGLGAVVVAFIGLMVFHRCEPVFADIT